MGKSKLEKLFYRGDYVDVVNQGLAKGAAADLPFLIGALAYAGRKSEAESLFLARGPALAPDDAFACRFFLGIAHVRAGDYAQGRARIAENYRLARPSGRVSHRARFYAYQGLGFYLYVAARFAGARRAADRAFAAASAARFGYGLALAGDLSGHLLVQTGHVYSGMHRLDAAEALAGKLGDGGLARSIRISRLVYRAQHGLAPESAIAELMAALGALDPQNSHAQANLLLELANQRMLRGQASEAARALDGASALIYRSQHRRYGHLLTLRLAELGYRSGQYAATLHTARSVRQGLNPRYDAVLILMAMGLEAKALRSLALPAEESVAATLATLTRRTGRAISSEILARSGCARLPMVAERLAQDGVARAFADASVESALAAGYLGLLPEALGVAHGARALLTGLAGHDLAIFDRGEVIYARAGISKLIVKLLSALAEKEHSKEELVQKLWGYAYDPLRHDALVFQAISRLRSVLGDRGHWIEAGENGYRLSERVEYRSLGEVAAAPAISRQEARSKSEPPRVDLNHRQRRLLELMRKQRFLGVADGARAFRVSEMTLRRDFATLMEAGLAVRTGRARSTRYMLSEADRRG